MANQFWLGENDQYGTARHVDGPHHDRAGVEKAAYLFNALGLTKGRTLVCMEVIVTEVQPSADSVNMEAVSQCQEMGLRPQTK